MTLGPFAAAILAAKEGKPPAHVDAWSLPWYDIPSLQAGVAVYAVLASEPKGIRLLPPSEAIPLLF